VVNDLTKSWINFGLVKCFTIVGIQSCAHCPWIMECKYTKLLHQNVNLGAQFDVMCHKVEWTKLVGLMEVVFHLYKYTPNKYLFFLVCPNLYVQNGPNPLRMKFPLIFHQKQKFYSKTFHPQKSTHKEFYIPLANISNQNITKIHPKVGPCQNPTIWCLFNME
jgi:hypothetical protein